LTEPEFAGQPLPQVSYPSPELVNQGNVEAIAALMNRFSNLRALPLSKLYGSCLQILLESAHAESARSSGIYPQTGK